MQFKIDENRPPELADLLAAAGRNASATCRNSSSGWGKSWPSWGNGGLAGRRSKSYNTKQQRECCHQAGNPASVTASWGMGIHGKFHQKPVPGGRLPDGWFKHVTICHYYADRRHFYEMVVEVCGLEC